MTNGAALLERLHVGHRNFQQEMRMIYELRKIECSWTNSQDVGRLATSFLPSNRHASQVQLRTIVSSLFRRGKNRKQIRIPVRETTTAVRFAVHRPTGGEFFFLQRPASFVQSGNYTIIADVRPKVPSIKGLSTSQWTVRGREAAIPLMAQNVYFHSDASGRAVPRLSKPQKFALYLSSGFLNCQFDSGPEIYDWKSIRNCKKTRGEIKEFIRGAPPTRV